MEIDTVPTLKILAPAGRQTTAVIRCNSGCSRIKSLAQVWPESQRMLPGSVIPALCFEGSEWVRLMLPHTAVPPCAVVQSVHCKRHSARKMGASSSPSPDMGWSWRRREIFPFAGRHPSACQALSIARPCLLRGASFSKCSAAAQGARNGRKN